MERGRMIEDIEAKDNEVCPKCGQGYLVTSTDFKRVCMCVDPLRYKMLRHIFNDAFGKEEEE